MASTNDNLNKLIAKHEERIEELESELQEQTNANETLTRRIESEDATWAQPRKWDEDDLPMPRLEMRWTRDDSYTSRCTYVLVFPHFLDKSLGEDERDIVSKPLGQTKSQGSERLTFWRFGDAELDTPFRDGAHAFHDAKVLKLPLFITTEDGDATEVMFDGDKRGQRVIRRGGSNV